MYMLWFTFFLGLNFIFLCLKLIIIRLYHTPKQRKIKFKLRKKLNHNIYNIQCSILFQFLCLLVCMAMNDDEFTLKPRKIKFKAKIKLNHLILQTVYTVCLMKSLCQELPV